MKILKSNKIVCYFLIFVMILSNIQFTFGDEDELIIADENLSVKQLLPRDSSIPTDDTIDVAKDPNTTSGNIGEVHASKTARWVNSDSNLAVIDLSIKGIPFTDGSDVILLMDTSRSMSYNNRIDIAKKSCIEFITKLLSNNEENNRVAFIPFTAYKIAGGDSDLEVLNTTKGSKNFSYNTEILTNHINSSTPTGATNYSAALKKAMNYADSRTDKEKSTRPLYIVFLSDGAPGANGVSPDNPNWNGINQAYKLKSEYGATIYTIGIEISPVSNEQYLKNISSIKNNEILYQPVKNVSDLSPILNIIANNIKYAAGTDAIFVDYISDYFEFVSCSPNIETYNNIDKSVSINIGNIPEEEETISIYVRLKDEYINTNNLYPTNKDVTLTYNNIQNISTVISKENIGEPTLNVENEIPKIKCTIEYYKDNVLFNSIIDNLDKGAIINSVPDLTPVGYMIDPTLSTSLPIELLDDTIIKVYYISDPNQKFEYIVNYIDSETNQPVANSFIGYSPINKNVTELALDIQGYNKISGTEKTITIEETNNIITFYYEKYKVIDGSSYIDVSWNYQAGSINDYTKRYNEVYKDVEEKEINYYVNLHYDSRYIYNNYRTRTDIKQTEVSVKLENTSYSAITGTAIMNEKTTFIDLYYIKEDKDDKDDDKEVPTKPTLNKHDHYAYIIGYPENDIRPLNKITREEVATIFYRLLTDESRSKFLSNSNIFSDVENSRWSNKAISTLYNANIIKGYPNGTFGPSEYISRAEFATIASNFDKLALNGKSAFTDIFGHWAEKYIISSENKGWIKGYPDLTFRPEQDISRAEAITLINNVLERHVKKENILSNAITWIDNPKSEWYYEAIVEATNSHDYTYTKDNDEVWVNLKANKIWP